jgi:membrane-associated phospholipid phosphatase
VEFTAKVALIGVYFTVWWTVYEWTNRHGCEPGQGSYFLRPVDALPGIIQPWTAPLYLFGGLALPLLPFYYHWNWPGLRFVLACYAVTSALAFLCYWLWPVCILRPSHEGPGLGRWLMRQVLSVDGDANCIPSSHVFYAVLAALLVSQAQPGRWTELAVWGLAAAIAVTTITTGQHYWFDIAGGVAVALVGYAVCRSIPSLAPGSSG